MNAQVNAHILVVDDVDKNVRLLADILTEMGKGNAVTLIAVAMNSTNAVLGAPAAANRGKSCEASARPSAKGTAMLAAAVDAMARL